MRFVHFVKYTHAHTNTHKIIHYRMSSWILLIVPQHQPLVYLTQLIKKYHHVNMKCHSILLSFCRPVLFCFFFFVFFSAQAKLWGYLHLRKCCIIMNEHCLLFGSCICETSDQESKNKQTNKINKETNSYEGRLHSEISVYLG